MRGLVWVAWASISMCLACGLDEEGGGGVAAGSGGNATTGGSGGQVAGGAGFGGQPTGGSAGQATGGSDGCAAGFACVPVVTQGTHAWSATGTVACPSGWNNATTYTDGGDPGCAACTCGTATGGTCSPAGSAWWENTSCTSGQHSAQPANGDCVDIVTSASDPSNGIAVAAPTATAGTCQPSKPAKQPVNEITICELAGATPTPCGSGMVCVPEKASGELCNLVPGGTACGASYGTMTAVQEVTNDDRQCACTCGAASGQSCSGAGVSLFAGDSCGGSALAQVVAGAGCSNTSQLSESSYKMNAGTWVGGTCLAQDDHTGSVQLGSPMALCCMP